MAMSFLLLSGAATLGATGLISGINGTIKITDSKKAIESAETIYKTKKREFDVQRKRTISELDRLALCQKQVQFNFFRFSDAFEKIKNRPNFDDAENENIEINDVSLDEIKSISIRALDILGGSALAIATGAATGAVAYGGTMAFGFASTGAAISGLHGIAATNATMAALGGGIASAGGGGMALGSIVLGGAVAAPVMAVAGLFVKNKGDESKEKAEEIVGKVEEATELMNESVGYMNRLRHISMGLRDTIEKLYEYYLVRVERLEELVERETNYMEYSGEEKELVDNNILIIKTLAHITRLALVEFSEEDNKEIILTENVKDEIKVAKGEIALAF